MADRVKEFRTTRTKYPQTDYQMAGTLWYVCVNGETKIAEGIGSVELRKKQVRDLKIFSLMFIVKSFISVSVGLSLADSFVYSRSDRLLFDGIKAV